MPPARTATKTQPAAPATPIGDPYIALTALSKPRRGRKDTDPNDLVMAGEVVHLTQEEAAAFLRYGPGTGRQWPAVEPYDPARHQQQPRIPPRAYSGQIWRPPQPQQGQDAAIPRPDPPGSSHVRIEQDQRVPEMSEPLPGSEQGSSWIPDALDLPPGASQPPVM